MKYVKVDKVKMEQALDKRGLHKSEASLGIGYGRSYIANACMDGNRGVGMAAVIGLEAKYGIKQEEYELIEPKEEQTPIDKPISELTSAELGELIYKSVYSAVLHAWQNDEE